MLLFCTICCIGLNNGLVQRIFCLFWGTFDQLFGKSQATREKPNPYHGVFTFSLFRKPQEPQWPITSTEGLKTKTTWGRHFFFQGSSLIWTGTDLLNRKTSRPHRGRFGGVHRTYMCRSSTSARRAAILNLVCWWEQNWGDYKIPLAMGGGPSSVGVKGSPLCPPPPLPTGILYSPQFRSHQETKMAASRTWRSVPLQLPRISRKNRGLWAP